MGRRHSGANAVGRWCKPFAPLLNGGAFGRVGGWKRVALQGTGVLSRKWIAHPGYLNHNNGREYGRAPDRGLGLGGGSSAGRCHRSGTVNRHVLRNGNGRATGVADRPPFQCRRAALGRYNDCTPCAGDCPALGAKHDVRATGFVACDSFPPSIRVWGKRRRQTWRRRWWECRSRRTQRTDGSRRWWGHRGRRDDGRITRWRRGSRRTRRADGSRRGWGHRGCRCNARLIRRSRRSQRTGRRWWGHRGCPGHGRRCRRSRGMGQGA